MRMPVPSIDPGHPRRSEPTARSVRQVMAAAIATTLVLLTWGLAGSPAVAASPTPFAAERCEGTTTSNPAQAVGAVPDLTQVFGQRLVDYNAGRSVILYGNDGTNGGTPNCSLHVDAQGNGVSEWLYCTDFTAKTCSVTDAQGNLTLAGQQMGSLVSQGTNSRLSADQTDLIGYLLTHTVPVTPVPYFLAPTATEASNATTDARMARQQLVWCVSDRGSFNGFGNSDLGTWCDANFGPAAQATVLAGMPTTPSVTVTPASVAVDAGQKATLTVTTNLLNQPLTVTSGSATVALCSGSAGTLSNGDLTLAGTQRGTATATLCVTQAAPGTATVRVSGQPVNATSVQWAQSPGNATYHCQVYAHLTVAPVAAVADSAALTYRAVVRTGGFSVVKKVVGAASSQVPASTVFTLRWSRDGGAATSVKVTADGTAARVSQLPAGTKVTVTEGALPTIAGVRWGTPKLSVNGVADALPATFTITADTVTALVLTNTAARVAVANASASAGATQALTAESAVEGELAEAGSSALDYLPVALFLLLAGGALILIAQRRGTN